MKAEFDATWISSGFTTYEQKSHSSQNYVRFICCSEKVTSLTSSRCQFQNSLNQENGAKHVVFSDFSVEFGAVFLGNFRQSMQVGHREKLAMETSETDAV
ncbi:unnamed protein product [Musa hybrid cultivar]